MKIAILSRDCTLFSCRRLCNSAYNRGHYIDVIDPFYCNIKICNNNSYINYHCKKLEFYDAIIPRVSPITTYCSNSILRQFEFSGSYLLNSSISISRSRDKFCSIQILNNNGIKTPITSFSDYYTNTSELINMVGGTPLIIKLLDGTQGIGVILAETNKAAESIIDTFRNLKIQFLLQEFIVESNCKDIRCLVLGNNVIASIERKAKKGDFRSNLHRGGTAENYEIDSNMKNIAISSAKILGLNFAGVDILLSNKGPLVIEVNSSPGLEGIESISKIDVANKIVSFIENEILKK